MNTFVVKFGIALQCMMYQRYEFQVDGSKCIKVLPDSTSTNRILMHNYVIGL